MYPVIEIYAKILKNIKNVSSYREICKNSKNIKNVSNYLDIC